MWKTIDLEPNYEISDLGEVRNKFTKKVKSLRVDRGGYSRVTLYPSGKTYHIHRLVALVFLKNENNLPVVNHINGVKTDNNVNNLEWCSYKHNVNHAYEKGLNKHRNIHGENNPSVKLNWKSVNEIRDLARDGVAWKEIAKMYNVKYNCVKRIVLNITWK